VLLPPKDYPYQFWTFIPFSQTFVKEHQNIE
jgi:hypothetical protein